MKKSTLLIALLAPFGLLAQTSYSVDNDPTSGANFTSLQSAIDAAQPGDTLYIHPTPANYGSITINKTIHLRGIAHYAEYNSGASAMLDNITFNAPIGAQNCSVSGLRFNRIIVSGNQNYSGLSITNNQIYQSIHVSSTPNACNNWHISGNRFHSGYSHVISKQNVNLHHNWLITNNFFHQTSLNTNTPIFSYMSFSDVIKNNIIVLNHNGSNSEICVSCSNAKIENSIVLFKGNSTGVTSNIPFHNSLSYSYPGQTLNNLPGTNNLNNTNPQFVNDGGTPDFGYSKDFHLSNASPGYTHGNDGQQIGIHGNNFNFIMRGYPNDLPYIKSFITSSVVSQGGTLNIQLEATGN